MAELPPGVRAEDKVVLFDGVCVMCSGGAQLLIRADKHRVFKLGTVQSPEGQAILAWHGLPTDSFSTFVLTEGPKLYTHSSAVVRIARQLPFPWKLAAGLWLVPRPIRDWGYRLIAANRYRLFGQRDQCVLLTADHAARLLQGTPAQRREA